MEQIREPVLRINDEIESRVEVGALIFTGGVLYSVHTMMGELENISHELIIKEGIK